MGRIQSTKVTANTNIIELIEAETTKNPCVFNGIIVTPTAIGVSAAGKFTIYNDNFGSSIEPTILFNLTGSTMTIVGGGVASFLNQGLMVGDRITLSETANNNISVTIASIAATVIVTEEALVNETPVATTIAKSNNTIGKFDYYHLHSGTPPADPPTPTMVHNFTNGILCADGLRIESDSWTNVEVYVLHS